MLDLLVPYIIAVLTQVAAIVGQQIARPSRRVATQGAADARAEFEYRLDIAQALPTMVTLALTAIAFTGDLGQSMTLITVAVAMICPAALWAILLAHEPQTYASRSILWGLVSPVSLVVFIVTLGLGFAAYLSGSSST